MLIRRMDQNWIKKKIKRISQTTLECVKQPANSQRRWERERQCSRRTWGQPSASLLSCKSPNSPRRCSSEGGKKQIRRRRGWEDEALKISMTMLVRYLIIISAENCISQQWWTDSKPAKASTFSTDVSFRCFHDDGKRGETAVIKHHQSGQTMRVCE